VYILEASSDSVVQINSRFGDEYASGGVAVAPVNSNRGSGSTLGTNVLTVYEGGASGDMALTSTGGVEFNREYLAANENHHNHYNGAIVLSSNTSISVTATGAASDKVNINIMIAYHTAGTKL